MHIVHVASECAPFAKIGGLGDVVSSLSQALKTQGHLVSIVLPKYDCIDFSYFKDLTPLSEIHQISHGNINIYYTIWRATFSSGISVFFLDFQDPSSSFSRGSIYGQADDPARFLLFCKGATSFVSSLHPDILHLHDWPTGGCVFFSPKAPTLFTIHNIEHQGKVTPHILEQFGASFLNKDLIDPFQPELVNLAKGAIAYSDKVVVVSPTYLEEILHSDKGFGLSAFLLEHEQKLHAILNGIDTLYWNPQTDPYIEKKYHIENALEGKKTNKERLQLQMGLEQNPRACLGVSVTRLAYQKGPHLIKEAAKEIAAQNGQFILLGSTPSPYFLDMFAELKDHPSIRLCFEHDEKLAHLLFAASDLFIMPSLYEPCGLTQMISMRYGSLPLVHATGGLKDTVVNAEKNQNKGNGFTFTSPEKNSLQEALSKAIEIYQHHSLEWQKLIKRAMNTSFGWDISAQKYQTIYKEMLDKNSPHFFSKIDKKNDSKFSNI